MVDAAGSTLGLETRIQSDWFKERDSLLKKLIDRRNLLFQRWLRSGHNSDRQKYVLERREVTKAVKKEKNGWILEKTNKVEVVILSAGSQKIMRNSLRKLQWGRVALRPVRTELSRKQILVRVLRSLLTAGKDTSVRY